MEQSPAIADTKLEELQRHLRDLALAKGPGAQLPSVREMCMMFSTTRVTLQLALRTLFAENILYSKQREGVFVSPKLHYKAIAILFDASIFALPAPSPFWSNLLVLFSQEIQRRATYKQETVTLHHILPAPDTSHSVPEDFISKIQAERIHGLLTVGLSTSSHEWIQQQEIPCVNFAGGGTWMVVINGEELGRQGTHELMDRGCERIGLWQFTTQRTEENIEENGLFKGLKRAHEERQRPLNTELVRIPRLPLTHLYPQKTISFQEQGYMLAKEVFGASHMQPPDGLVIGDEMVAHGALIALQQMGIQVGRDVQIVTHSNANSPILFGLTENLLMYEFDARELVQTMFSVLDMLMVGQQPTSRLTRVTPHRRF